MISNLNLKCRFSNGYVATNNIKKVSKKLDFYFILFLGNNFCDAWNCFTKYNTLFLKKKNYVCIWNYLFNCLYIKLKLGRVKGLEKNKGSERVNYKQKGTELNKLGSKEEMAKENKRILNTPYLILSFFVLQRREKWEKPWFDSYKLTVWKFMGKTVILWTINIKYDTL